MRWFELEMRYVVDQIVDVERNRAPAMVKLALPRLGAMDGRGRRRRTAGGRNRLIIAD
jgi:hypothetical protein